MYAVCALTGLFIKLLCEYILKYVFKSKQTRLYEYIIIADII